MSKNQIGINMIANVLSLAVSMGINFFFTPYLVKNVGIEAYSFMPMTGNITSYFMIISTALNSMAARFITIAIHKNDQEKAMTYFNTVFFSNIALSTLFFIIFAVIVIFLDSILKIPTEIVFDIKALFALTFLSTIITLLTTVFSVATFCKNRLDLNSIVQITTSLLRIVVLIMLFMFFKPNILYIGVASIAVALCSGVENVFFTKKLLPNIKIAKRYFDKKAVKILVGSGIWNSISQSGNILLTGVDIVLANMFLNATSAGNIAIAKTIPALVYTVSGLVVAAFYPEFTILYAQGKHEELIKSIKSSIKIMSVTLSIPLAGVVAFGYDFYKLWIPTQDIKIIYILTLVTMIPTFISVFISPLGNIYGVTNKLKKPTIFAVSLGIANISLVLILLNIMPINYGIYIISGVSGVLLLSDVLLFKPIYAAKCLNIKWNTFYPYILRSIISTSVLILIFLLINMFTVINTWADFFIVAGVSSAIGLLLNYITMLNKNERKYCNKIFENQLNKVMSRLKG